MKKPILIILFVFVQLTVFAQINVGLFRFPDVSQTHIVFTYANVLWVVPKEGGRAYRLRPPPGVESYPKFSPDGKPSPSPPITTVTGMYF